MPNPPMQPANPPSGNPPGGTQIQLTKEEQKRAKSDAAKNEIVDRMTRKSMQDEMDRLIAIINQKQDEDSTKAMRPWYGPKMEAHLGEMKNAIMNTDTAPLRPLSSPNADTLGGAIEFRDAPDVLFWSKKNPNPTGDSLRGINATNFEYWIDPRSMSLDEPSDNHRDRGWENAEDLLLRIVGNYHDTTGHPGPPGRWQEDWYKDKPRGVDGAAGAGTAPIAANAVLDKFYQIVKSTTNQFGDQDSNKDEIVDPTEREAFLKYAEETVKEKLPGGSAESFAEALREAEKNLGWCFNRTRSVFAEGSTRIYIKSPAATTHMLLINDRGFITAAQIGDSFSKAWDKRTKLIMNYCKISQGNLSSIASSLSTKDKNEIKSKLYEWLFNEYKKDVEKTKDQPGDVTKIETADAALAELMVLSQAEPEKKEVKMDKDSWRFDPQSFLYYTVEKVAKHRQAEKRSKGAADMPNLILVEATPSDTTNYLTSAHKAKIFDITTAQASHLIPQIRFYSVSRSNGLTTKETLIKFNTYTTPSDIRRIYSRGSRGGGVGIESLEIEFQGTDLVSVDKLFSVKTRILIQDAETLTKKNQDSHVFRLIQYPIKRGGDYQELRLELGWSVDDATNVLFDSKFKREMQRQKMTLFLGLKDHTFTINPDGTVALDIEFHGRVEEILGGLAADVFPGQKGIDAEVRKLVQMQSALNTEEGKNQYMTQMTKAMNEPLDSGDGYTPEEVSGGLRTAVRLPVYWHRDNVDTLETDYYDHTTMGIMSNTINYATYSKSKLKDRELRATVRGEEYRVTNVKESDMNGRLLPDEIVFVLEPIDGGKSIEVTAENAWGHTLYFRGRKLDNVTGKDRNAAVQKTLSVDQRSQDFYNERRRELARQISSKQSENLRKRYQAILTNIQSSKKIYQTKVDANEQENFKLYCRSEGQINKTSSNISVRRAPGVDTDADADGSIIKFFYYGDLVQEVMSTMKQNHQGGDKDVAPKVRAYDIALGTVKITGPDEPMKFCNIAYMPITLPTYLKWFEENITKKKRVNYPFMTFLKDIANDLIFKVLGGNMLEHSEHMKPSVSRLSMTNITLSAASPIFKKENRLVDLSVLKKDHATQGKNSKRLRELLLLYALPGQGSSAHRVGNQKKDATNGVHHIVVGRDRGLLKDISFAKANIPGWKESKTLRAVVGGTEDHIYANAPYNCDVTLIGNTIFKPGMTIFVDPLTTGFGSIKNKNSVARKLRIGGYYTILGATHYVKGSVFETSLRCVHDSIPGEAEKVNKSGGKVLLTMSSAASTPPMSQTTPPSATNVSTGTGGTTP